MQGECQALDGFLSGGGGEKQAVDRKEHRERLNRNLLSSLSPSVPSSPPSYGPRSHHQVPLSPCSGATAPRPMLPKAPGAARGVAGERVPTSDRPPLAPGLAPDQLLTLGRFLTLLTYVLIGRMSPRQSRPSGPTRCQWSPMRGGWAGPRRLLVFISWVGHGDSGLRACCCHPARPRAHRRWQPCLPGAPLAETASPLCARRGFPVGHPPTPPPSDPVGSP